VEKPVENTGKLAVCSPESLISGYFFEAKARRSRFEATFSGPHRFLSGVAWAWLRRKR